MPWLPHFLSHNSIHFSQQIILNGCSDARQLPPLFDVSPQIRSVMQMKFNSLSFFSDCNFPRLCLTKTNGFQSKQLHFYFQITLKLKNNMQRASVTQKVTFSLSFAQRCASCILQMWCRSICFSFSSFMCYVFCMEALIRMFGVLFNDTWAHRSLLYQWITAFLPAYLLRPPSHFPNASLQYSGDKWGVLGE